MLRDEELIALLTFRLGHYLAIAFLDAERAHAERLEHEPREAISPDDIHIVALDALDETILSHAVLRRRADAP
jgi:hypothetical protein